MTVYNVTSQIDGTSALKINYDSVQLRVLQASSCNQDIQEYSSFTPVEDLSKEDSFFADDLRITFEASGLADIIPNLKQGSIAGMPYSLSLRGIVGIVFATFIIALLMIM